MACLIRLDRTGHTTLAEWTAEDAAAQKAKIAALYGKPVGTKGAWLCPICGTTNAKKFYVCGNCGKGLSP